MTNAAAVRWRSTRRSWRPCGPGDADRLRRVLTAHTANVHEAALQRYGKED